MILWPSGCLKRNRERFWSESSLIISEKDFTKLLPLFNEFLVKLSLKEISLSDPPKEISDIYEHAHTFETSLSELARFSIAKLDSISFLFTIMKSQNNSNLVTPLDIIALSFLLTKTPFEEYQDISTRIRLICGEIKSISYIDFRVFFKEKKEKVDKLVEEFNNDENNKKFNFLLGIKSQWHIFRNHYHSK